MVFSIAKSAPAKVEANATKIAKKKVRDAFKMGYKVMPERFKSTLF